MDQVTYPSRAARVMQELGIQDAGGDMAFSIAEDNDMEVDQENMAPSHEQGKTYANLHVSIIALLTKSAESSFQGRVRRVLRPLNRQPLYDMTLHPQDDALAELEDGSMPASDFEIYVDDDEDQV